MLTPMPCRPALPARAGVPLLGDPVPGAVFGVENSGSRCGYSGQYRRPRGHVRELLGTLFVEHPFGSLEVGLSSTQAGARLCRPTGSGSVTRSGHRLSVCGCEDGIERLPRHCDAIASDLVEERWIGVLHADPLPKRDVNDLERVSCPPLHLRP